MRAASDIFLFGNDGYFSAVGRLHDGVPVQQETLPRIESQTCGSGRTHNFDRLYTNDRNVKTHVLIGLGDFEDREGSAQGGSIALERAHQLPSPLDGCVRAFHGLNRNAGSLSD